MTYREAVYLIMDLLHLMSDDAGYTEQHIIFLLNKYRIYLLKNADKENPLSNDISDSAYQTIDLTLEKISTNLGIQCVGSFMTTDPYYIWRSTEKVPTLASVGIPRIFYNKTASDPHPDLSPSVPTDDFYQVEMPYVSMDRMKYVGQNKWTKNFLYCSIGPDNYLYAKSVRDYGSPLTVHLKAIFEDPEDIFGDDSEILDEEFPIDESLIPQLIDFIVKLIAAAEYRPDDPFNNAADDLSRMAQYLRSRMKTDFQRQLNI